MYCSILQIYFDEIYSFFFFLPAGVVVLEGYHKVHEVTNEKDNNCMFQHPVFRID